MSEGIKLSDWRADKTNHPRETMLWNKAFFAQLDAAARTTRCLFEYALEHEEALRVVGTHYSKGICLPVYFVDLSARGIRVQMCDNFHDWKVSVSSERSLSGVDFLDIFDPGAKHHEYYCEGMSEVYGSFRRDPSRFTVSLRSDEDLSTFFRVLRRFIKSPPHERSCV